MASYKQKYNKTMLMLLGSTGNCHPIDVILDSGSGSNFITEQLVNLYQLGPPKSVSPKEFSTVYGRFTCSQMV